MSTEGAVLYFDDLRLIYRGQFVNSMREGFGTISSEESTIPGSSEIKHAGPDEEDQLAAKSMYHFEGNFVKDKKEGEGQLYAKGIWVSKLGNSSVLGTGGGKRSFISNAEDGEQILVSEKYSGNFSNDAFHGEGVYIDGDGKVYEGEFRHGKMVEDKEDQPK